MQQPLRDTHRPEWSGDPSEDHPDNYWLYAQAQGTASISPANTTRREREDSSPAPAESNAHNLSDCGALSISSSQAQGYVQNLRGAIDLGYISFLLAKNPDTYNTKARKIMKEWLVIGEGNSKDVLPVRKRQYELYKSRRKAKAKTLEREALDYRERVWALREMVSQDPWLTYASHPLAEADDLVGLWALCVGGKVVGIDKDFWSIYRASQLGMLPQPVTFYSDIEADEFCEVQWDERKGLLKSQYVKALDDGSPGYWVLAQACLGDKSDSIPRLLPSGVFTTVAKQFWRELVTSLRDWYEQFGMIPESLVVGLLRTYGMDPIDLRRNLMLVLVPYPTFRNANTENSGEAKLQLDTSSSWTLENLLTLVVSGRYWSETEAWMPFFNRVLEDAVMRHRALVEIEEQDWFVKRTR